MEIQPPTCRTIGGISSRVPSPVGNPPRPALARQGPPQLARGLRLGARKK